MTPLAFAAAFVAWLSVLLAALSAGQHAPVAWPAAFALVAIGAAMVAHGAGMSSAQVVEPADADTRSRP